MKIHLIALGGAIMHNLAIALHEKGYTITGSDDEIYEPAKSRLEKHDLLPEEMGWFPGKISLETDVVILGMHAKKDNPELLKALELGLVTVSFPQFIYYSSQYKRRIVIVGSHGKTTVTSMVMHVLRNMGKDFDYAVGSSIEGFENSVRLSKDAPIIVIEGDEYLSSPIDRQPKFLWYKPHVAYITGIAWDHINVFPTYEEYFMQFVNFVETMEPGNVLIYNSTDPEVLRLVENHASHLQCIPAEVPFSFIEDGKTCVVYDDFVYELEVFGKHNLQNLAGAMYVCEQMNILPPVFLDKIESFKGAGRRLEKLLQTDELVIFKDFAHAPSKVLATVQAVREQFPEKKLLAVLELHTFSSLNPDFIQQYKGSLDAADKPVVYINPETQKAKVEVTITKEDLVRAFGREDLIFVENKGVIQGLMETKYEEPIVLLMMTSGNFGGLNLESIVEKMKKGESV